MGITYNYLKNVWRNKVRPAKYDALIYLLALTLATIPLDFKYNSIALTALAVYSLFSAKRNRFNRNFYLLLPVALFIVMALSGIWSVDPAHSVKSLSKALPLVIIPWVFFINPQLSKQQVHRVLDLFSAATLVCGVCFLFRATLRYLETNDKNVFFYHELAGDVNAIYLSSVFSIALFHLLFLKPVKWYNIIWSAFAGFFILLLSSKTVIAIDFLLCLVYIFFILHKRRKTLFFLLLLLTFAAVFFAGKFVDRWAEEVKANTTVSSEYVQVGNSKGVVYDVNIHDAWHVRDFGQDKRFTGTSFRVYQIRIFLEMLYRDNIFFTGYGYNASQPKIVEKGFEHNIFMGSDNLVGYQNMNFHNQYIQVFAELGIIGLIILLALTIFNLKKAIKQKYFVHIAFAILMLTLFLTESFIWRQRGVVLFTVLYCLFNTIASEEKETL